MRCHEAWLAPWFEEGGGGLGSPRTAAGPCAGPAYGVLCLIEGAPAELVEAARRVLAKRYHLDQPIQRPGRERPRHHQRCRVAQLSHGRFHQVTLPLSPLPAHHRGLVSE